MCRTQLPQNTGKGIFYNFRFGRRYWSLLWNDCVPSQNRTQFIQIMCCVFWFGLDSADHITVAIFRRIFRIRILMVYKKCISFSTFMHRDKKFWRKYELYYAAF